MSNHTVEFGLWRATMASAPRHPEDPDQSSVERVALIDGDAGVLDALRMLFEAHELTVYAFATPEAFLAPPGPPASDALLLDIGLPDMAGLRMLDRWRDRPTQMRVFLLSFHVDAEIRLRAAALGVEQVLQKPVEQTELFGALGLA